MKENRSQQCFWSSPSEEIFSDGRNFSYDSKNDTEVEMNYTFMLVVYLSSMLLSFPINSYVMWLIVRGAGNGLSAEFFSLNLCICEIFICCESVFTLLTSKHDVISIVVYFLDGFAIVARPLFQCLICVERYLAVVHPVIFLKTKPLRYRVICSAVAWFAGLVSAGVNMITLSEMFSQNYFHALLVEFLFFFSIQMFCLVSVLRALKQSGPGERRRDGEEENHMKRRAFQIILVTAVPMLILYMPYAVLLSPECKLMFISFLCYVLAGLVQPLLFLYRVGKLHFMECQ